MSATWDDWNFEDSDGDVTTPPFVCRDCYRQVPFAERVIYVTRNENIPLCGPCLNLRLSGFSMQDPRPHIARCWCGAPAILQTADGIDAVLDRCSMDHRHIASIRRVVG